MKVRIAIIGLGQIGTSMGLALGAYPRLVSCVGSDVNPQVAQQAFEIDAIEQVFADPQDAVRDADVVVLSLPMDQLRSMIAEVAPAMKPGATLIDTAPIKEVVSGWAKEMLLLGCQYVGLTPVINPKYLHGNKTGIRAARIDLFRNSVMAVAAPPWTDSKAIKLAADLARLLGATPMMVDLIEIDALMTATHIIPQLMAAALLNATVDQPGWRQASKLAGRAYAEVSGPLVHLGEPGALAKTTMLNDEGVLRVIDSVLASLEALRNDIANRQFDSLTQRLERARQGRDLWWDERLQVEVETTEDPLPQTSPASGMFGDLLRKVHRPKMEDQ
jgi:prephenate dehydrogenase